MMSFPSGILKNNSISPISPHHHYPVSANPYDGTGGRNSTVSFIASSMSMLPEGPNSPNRLKLSEYDLDEDLEPLAEKNMVFIRQLPQDIERYINVPNKYQVVSSSGDRLYDVVETTDGVTRRLFRRDQPFTMRVINNYGEYICELIGDPGVGGLGAFVKLKRESSILGKVVQVNPLFACCNFSPRYNVQNEKGKTVQKILWQRGRFKSCMFTEDFQVYSAAKSGGLTGSISRQTKAICLEDYSQADTYALSFQDVQMDRIQKALLVAAVIMLDFQFFEGREGSDLWKVAVCCVLIILVILLVVGIVIYLVAESAK
ncbi:unnamed protein product [Orchesella dallaii]|uniref:Phospholipid scramblase n=1 Tax=Orchesella dallaii TaxID=48710 RepID=A0ABP1R6M7_9HEXA